MEPWTRLWLMRHGRVAEEWHGRVYGDLDLPLSADGEDQGRRVAAVFSGHPLWAVVSSGLERAEFTAAHIRTLAEPAPGRAPFERRDDPRLRELNRGDWAGLELAAIQREWPAEWERFVASGWTAPPPGAESLDELAARVLPALDDWAARAEGEVAIVAHKWVLRVAVCEALGLAFERSPSVELETSSLVALDWPRAGRATGPAPRVIGLDLARIGAD